MLLSTPAFAGNVVGQNLTPNCGGNGDRAFAVEPTCPAASLDFTMGRYSQAGVNGTGLAADYLTTTRASVGLAPDSTGLWSSFSSGAPRVTNAGLLIEEARTNSAIQNIALNNAAWTSTLVNATYSQTDPSAGTAAALLVPNGTNSTHQTFNTTGMTLTAAVYTWSAFFKTNGYNFAYIDAASTGGTNRFTAVADLTTGAVTQTTNTGSPTATATQTVVYPNGWVRLCVSMTATVGAASDFIEFGASPTGTPTLSGGSPTFAGNSASGVIAAWPMVELGLGCSSPILTTTTALTRAADVIVLKNALTFGAGYTVYASGVPLFPSTYVTTQTPLQADDGTNNNRLDIDRGSGSGALAMGLTFSGQAWSVPGGSTVIAATGASLKAAYSLAPGNQNSARNGSVDTQATVSPIFTPTRIVVGANGNFQHQFDGEITKIQVWPTTALPQPVLQQMTSGSTP